MKSRTIYSDAKMLDKRIHPELVRRWVRENIETRASTRSKKTYVAQHACHEYQAGLLIITDKQVPNQAYPVGSSMIDVFSKYATVILQERGPEHIMLQFSRVSKT